MLSRTGEYALRALIHLAQRVDDWPLTGKLIAEEAGIASKYLSKVLGDLVRAYSLGMPPFEDPTRRFTNGIAGLLSRRSSGMGSTPLNTHSSEGQSRSVTETAVGVAG